MNSEKNSKSITVSSDVLEKHDRLRERLRKNSNSKKLSWTNYMSMIIVIVDDELKSRESKERKQP